jgi:N-acetylmuramic acid 6-phosphate etherase
VLVQTAHDHAATDLVLGIDGGGSRTVALLAPADHELGEATPMVLGRGIAGPSNLQAVGRQVMVHSLEQAVHDAFAAARLKPGPVAAACLGLAGADRTDDRRSLLDWAADRQLAAKVAVENDCRLVLAAGTPADWGVAVIAGTGSMVLARTPEGQMRRSGGWGYLFGDEGSAYALTLAGLRAVTRAFDGSAPGTMLTELLLARLQVAEVKAIVPAVYGRGLDRAEIARLADVVTTAAEAGDAVAINCLDNAAAELACTAGAAARLLTDNAIYAIPLTFSGSLLTSCPNYADRVLSRLRVELHADPRPFTFVKEPAAGAIRLARKMIASEI